MDAREGKVWHRFADEKPTKNGGYACLVRHGDNGVSFQTLHFYKDSGKFNCPISGDPDLEIVPAYWADFDELMKATACDIFAERADWIVI